MIPKSLADRVQKNRKGWYAIRHIDGWWVGDKTGVTCYLDNDIARAALTLIWSRDHDFNRCCPYRIQRFNGTDLVDAGEHTPKRSMEEAWKDLPGTVTEWSNPTRFTGRDKTRNTGGQAGSRQLKGIPGKPDGKTTQDFEEI
jgi:hypothetical protein